MTVWQWIGDAIWTSIPVVGVLGLFIILIRSIVRADRKEREVYSKIEAELRAEREAKAKGAKKP
ncbi:MAG: hypothetical protein ACKOWJ_04600 [Micrococcales bacterium]